MVITGETYEYMVINDKSIVKLTKCLSNFPDKSRIEFLDINKVKIQSIRQAKELFSSIDQNLPSLRYMTLEQSALPSNFILQFKNFLDGNDSLVRLSLAMN